MSMPATWVTNPMDYFLEGGGDMAVKSLEVYQSFTGFYFDKIALESSSEPFRITWSDIASVSGLSVNIEAPTAWNIVHDDGLHTTKVNALLHEIDPELLLADASKDDLKPAYQLWSLLQKENGLGGSGVTLSKLLTAKRPNLLPIRDRFVLEALFQLTKTNSKGELNFDFALDDWEPWREYMNGTHGAEVTDAVNEALKKSHYPIEISILRAIDIVIWMRHQGWKDGRGYLREGLPSDFGRGPTFMGSFESKVIALS